MMIRCVTGVKFLISLIDPVTRKVLRAIGSPTETKIPISRAHDEREMGHPISSSLQSKTFADQPLQPRLVEKIKGELFVGEHGERGFLRTGG
jgi:hypothetical protein